MIGCQGIPSKIQHPLFDGTGDERTTNCHPVGAFAAKAAAGGGTLKVRAQRQESPQMPISGYLISIDSSIRQASHDFNRRESIEKI